MKHSTERALATSIIAVGAVLAAFGGLAWALIHSRLGLHISTYGVLAALVFGFLILWHALIVISRHFVEVKRLRYSLRNLSHDPSAVLPTPTAEASGGELAAVLEALADLAATRAQLQAQPDNRLQAVLAANSDAIVVMTDQGQVSLVNYAAKRLLGAERVRVGTSVFAALDRPSLLAAMKSATASRRPLQAQVRTVGGQELEARIAGLGDHGGAVISIASDDTLHRAELELDLALHDRPPEAPPVTGETPLQDLPLLVLDCETTGLDVTQDRVVSLGALRLHGLQAFRSTALDLLIHPGQAIPARSTAIHGITDAMVAQADDFATAFDQFQALQQGAAVLGHNTAFDLTMLERECALAGLTWQRPLFLDTLLLSAALDPGLDDHDLDQLAERMGIEVRGRHTAMGDSLITAQVYFRLVPRLADAGVTTLGEAQAFSRKADVFFNRQKQMGWH